MRSFFKPSHTLQQKKSISSASNTSDDQPGIDSMTTGELNAALELVLDDMNLTDDKKDVLRKQSDAQKRQLLDMNYKRTQTIKSSNALSFTTALENKLTKPSKRLHILQTLRVHLRSDTLPWIKSFGRRGFLTILNNMKILLKSSHVLALHEGILCVSSFINSTFGMEEALGVDDFMLILTQCLRVNDHNLLVDLLKIIAAVCIYPRGHEKVLEGFSRQKKIEKIKHRFANVVSALSGPTAVQSMGFQLVNAIVSTPDDWEMRQHLRAELMRSGMAEIYSGICDSKHPDIKRHAEIFISQLNDDVEEFGFRFDMFSREFNTLDDCWTFLRSVVAGREEEEESLLSVLQHLLFIRDDPYSRPAYFDLVETLVGQIVVQRGGMDPDPAYRTFNVDFDAMAGNSSNKMQKKDQMISDIKEEYENKLSAALSAKMEAESKISLLEAKLTDLGDKKLNSSQKLDQSFRGDKSGMSSPRVPGSPAPPPLPLPPTPASVPPPPPRLDAAVPPPPPAMSKKASKPATDKLPFGMKPKPKLPAIGCTKRLNWNKIKPELFKENSLWVTAKEDRFRDSAFMKSVEKFFAASNALSKPIAPGTSEPVKRKTKQLRLVDGNVSQAISILMANLKLSPDELKGEFMAVNCAKIQMVTLEQLLKALPDDLTMGKFKEFESVYDELADSEKFLFKLAEIGGLRTRVETMLFMEQYEESSAETKSSIASVTEACNQIMESTKFRDVVEIVLLIGNILNINTRNSETYGFDLTILPRLYDTKSHDGSLSFIHFLVETLQNKCPGSMVFHKDLTSVEKAALVCPQMILQSLGHYDKNIKKLGNLIPVYVKQSKDDRFGDSIRNFYDVIHPQQELLVAMKTRMDEAYTKLCNFFALSPRVLPTNQFFEAIYKFCVQFKDVVDEINTRKDFELKKESRSTIKVKNFQNDAGIMDSLVEALKSGSAFKHESRKRVRNNPVAKGCCLGSLDLSNLMKMNNK